VVNANATNTQIKRNFFVSMFLSPLDKCQV
jgi:hypothetical protein